MKDSNISWTHHTFNLAWGCDEVSPECANCYARVFSQRLGRDLWGKGKPREVLSPSYWKQPLKWDRAARKTGERNRVFCSSMADVFEDHPTITEQRQRLWEMIRQTQNLDWLLLTKRAERIEGNLPADWGQGYANVWLGVTVGHPISIPRANYLRRIPAAVRFLSAEPLLGPLPGLSLEGIDWVIVGGETAPDDKRREMRPEWARDLRDRCQEQGVAFFFKQSSHRYPGHGKLDGERIQQYPRPRGGVR